MDWPQLLRNRTRAFSGRRCTSDHHTHAVSCRRSAWLSDLLDATFTSFYNLTTGYAAWFTAGGAIRIVLRQLWQTWKLRHYDVIDNIITQKL